MASVVQATNYGAAATDNGFVTATPMTRQLPLLPATANSILVSVAFNDNFTPGVISSVTDNQGVGNVYVKVKQQNDGDSGNQGCAELWWCPSYTSGGVSPYTATINYGGTMFGQAAVMEASGLTGVVDQTSGQGTTTGTSLTQTNGSANTGANGDLVVATILCAQYNTSTALSSPATSGYSVWGTGTGSDGGRAAQASYKIVTSTETSSAAWTWTGAQQSAAILATFKASPPPLVGAALASAARALATGSALMSVPFSVFATGKSTFNVAQSLAVLAQAESALLQATLLNWASVTLVGPLYTGLGGALDGYLWTTPFPQIGTVLYYDPTFLTIAANGEISSTSNNCSSLIGFYDPSAGWTIGLYVITPGNVSGASSSASLTATLSGNVASFASVARDLASLSASISSAINLVVSAGAVASSVGTLVNGSILADQATALASLLGTLTTTIRPATLAADLASAAGQLKTAIQAATLAAGVATATPALKTAITLSSAAAGVASGTPTLISPTSAALVTAASALASVADQLATSIRTVTNAGAIATAQPFLTTPKPITSSAAALSSLTATLRFGSGFSILAAGLSSATASLQTRGTFASMASSAASLSASLITLPVLTMPILLSHQIPGIYQPGAIPQGQFELPLGTESVYGIDWTYWICFRWQPGYSAPLNYVVRPFPWTGFQYVCTTPGQTGNYPPVWPEELGQLVVDGSVVWTAEPIDSTSLQTTVVSASYAAPPGIVATPFAITGNTTPVMINSTGATKGQTYEVTCTAFMASGDFLIGQLIFNVD